MYLNCNYNQKFIFFFTFIKYTINKQLLKQ